MPRISEEPEPHVVDNNSLSFRFLRGEFPGRRDQSPAEEGAREWNVEQNGTLEHWRTAGRERQRVSPGTRSPFPLQQLSPSPSSKYFQISELASSIEFHGGCQMNMKPNETGGLVIVNMNLIILFVVRFRIQITVQTSAIKDPKFPSNQAKQSHVGRNDQGTRDSYSEMCPFLRGNIDEGLMRWRRRRTFLTRWLLASREMRVCFATRTE